MFEAVTVLTRERARNQSLTLTMLCPPDIGAIEADERRLKQALFNLISNAIKFTPAGGTITGRGRVGTAGDLLSWRSADTGVGIPPADQERVSRNSSAATRRPAQSGAGLGLSLVKSLIELHGGSVMIESGTGAAPRSPAACRPAVLPAEPAAEPR